MLAGDRPDTEHGVDVDVEVDSPHVLLGEAIVSPSTQPIVVKPSPSTYRVAPARPAESTSPSVPTGEAPRIAGVSSSEEFDHWQPFEPFVVVGNCPDAATYLERSRRALEEFYERVGQLIELINRQLGRFDDTQSPDGWLACRAGRGLIDAATQVGLLRWIKCLFGIELKIRTHAELLAWCRLQQRGLWIRRRLRAGRLIAFSRRESEWVSIDAFDLSRYVEKLPTRLQNSPEQVAVELGTLSLQWFPNDRRALELRSPILRKVIVMVWEAMRKLSGQHRPAEPESVRTTLEARRALDRVIKWCERHASVGTLPGGAGEESAIGNVSSKESARPAEGTEAVAALSTVGPNASVAEKTTGAAAEKTVVETLPLALLNVNEYDLRPALTAAEAFLAERRKADVRSQFDDGGALHVLSVARLRLSEVMVPFNQPCGLTGDDATVGAIAALLAMAADGRADSGVERIEAVVAMLREAIGATGKSAAAAPDGTASSAANETGTAKTPYARLSRGQQSIVDVIREAGHRLSQDGVLAALETKHGAASIGTTKNYLAALVKFGVLNNRRDVAPPGYGLAEWH